VTEQPLLTFLWEHSHLLMFLADERGVVLRGNQEAEKVFRKPLAGHPLTSLLGRADLSEVGGPYRINLMSGEEKADTYYFHILPSEGGRLAIGETDPTETSRLRKDLMALHAELSLLTRDLQKKNVELDILQQLKNRFLGVAAHDLRNPLGVLLGHTKLLRRSPGEENPAVAESLAAIQTSAEFALRLLDDLLDISHIESGKWDLNLSESDLAAWLEAFLDRNEPRAAEKGIRLERRVQHPLPLVRMDPLRVEQVASNLLTNALKYSPSGTKVTVALGESEGGLLLSVIDQGPGIPASEVPRLFEDFARASVPTTGGEKSTGLGLSIVRRIMEAHGGKAWVESEEGKGSTFQVWFPLGNTASKSGSIAPNTP